MKTTLLILSVFVAFTNACNQNTTNQSTETANTEKTVALNNSDTISNEIKPKEVVSETKIEQTKVEKTTINKSETKKEYFTLLSATSQSWTAGIPSGGSGTDYYFKIKINSADKIKFDSAWINNKRFEIFISRETAAISNEQINFSKGDNITLRVSEIKNQNIKTENLKPPLEYEGAALIGYIVNDKRQYFIIKEIKKQSLPNRP